MANVIIESKSYTVDSLYQWDINQELVIYGLSLATIPAIHFTNDAMDKAIVRQATMDDTGVIRCDIPNSLLQKPYKIRAYVCIYEGDTFKSLYLITIPVNARSMPTDYTITVSDDEVYSFNALENKLENTLAVSLARYDEVNKKYEDALDGLRSVREYVALGNTYSVQASSAAQAANKCLNQLLTEKNNLEEEHVELLKRMETHSTTIQREVMDRIFSGGQLKASDNHFDKNSVVNGFLVHLTNGLLANENSIISDYIPVNIGTTIYINNIPLYTSSEGQVRRLALFDENKNWIATPSDAKISHGSSQYSYTVTTEGAKYIVFAVYQSMTSPDLLVADNYAQIMVTFDQYRDYADYIAPSEVPDVVLELSKPTRNKKMLIFGDSITESATMNDDGTNYTEGTRLNWITYAQTMLETNNFKNYAKSGATYKDNASGEYRQSLSNQIALALADSSNDTAEIIVLSLGTNDGSANDDFNTAMAVETVTGLDRTKLHQAIRYAMWSLKTKYPNAKCFVATPIQRAAREQDVSLRNAIISMANRYNFKVIDAEYESGIVRDNEVLSGEGVDLYDGLHPNENGAKKMAELYSSVILNTFSFNAKC